MPRPATLLATLSLVSLAAFARTEERDVPAFDSVSIASGIHATIAAGPRTLVRVDAPDDLLPLVETRVEGGTLEVGFKRGANIRTGGRVDVTIEAPRIQGISASGGAFVRATLARAARVALQASGGSEIHLRGLDADRLAAEGSGGSVLEVEGRAGALELEISGGTRILGTNLSVQDVSVQASGGSTGDLRCDGRIRGGLSGGSELHVRGRARSAVLTSGGSRVEVDD